MERRRALGFIPLAGLMSTNPVIVGALLGGAAIAIWLAIIGRGGRPGPRPRI